MNSEFSRDVWLGGLVGALRGVADVIGDYQQTHHNYSIASYEAGLDAGAENYLAQVALDFGLSEEKVLGRYWALRQEISPRAALAAVEDQLGLAPRQILPLSDGNGVVKALGLEPSQQPQLLNNYTATDHDGLGSVSSRFGRVTIGNVRGPAQFVDVFRVLPHTGACWAIGLGGSVPEPGEVKHGLVWTGSQWVPLRPSASDDGPDADAGTGANPGAGEVPPGVDPVGPDSSGNQCPVCRKDDRLVRVSGLLDSASSHTTGSGTTVGVGAGSGGLGAGVAVSEFQAETVTRLVQRFAPPSAPRGVGCGITALSVLGVLVVGGILGALGAPDAVSWIVIAAGIGAGIYAYFRFSPARAAQKAVWQECLDEVRSAYYCSRDDVAFEPGDVEASTPEALVLTLFEPYFEVTRKRSE